MKSNIETIEKLDPRLLEYPFVRAGMTLAEYEEEREYYSTQFDEVKNGTYKPLWKQRLESA